MAKFSFPKIDSINIENFSLYRKITKVSIDIDKNVFCLVGANGLGKSTFITIINYGLTGIVKNSERTFSWYKSVNGFYSQSKSFATSYFDGRINEDDYDLAQVTIAFKLNKAEYEITRGFFEPDELRSLKIKRGTEYIEYNDNNTSADLDEIYKSHFVKDSGLSDFAQFVFLQSYVFTFDESHHLLFWDSAIMERVLYLFFGLDSSTAKKADKLRKDFNANDSRFRNLQWQITQSKNELKKILGNLTDKEQTPEELDIVERHKKLLSDFETLQEEFHDVGKEIQECDLNIADLSISISSLKAEYDEAFNNSMPEEVPVEKDEQILRIIKEIKSKIFSNDPFQDSIDKLIQLIHKQKESTQSTSKQESFEALKKIDERLNKELEKQAKVQSRKERFIQKEKELQLKISDVNTSIKEIEKTNEDLFNNLSNSGSADSIEFIKNSFQETIDRLSEQKEDSRNKRALAKEELKKLESEMSKSFLQAEETFIPRFSSFAKSFLGLDIDIELNSTSKGASLGLRIDDDKRKDSYQLSESQRYFIDIALRMALLGIGANEAGLLIDTPEGSLDIAYESRAGKMIADFSNNGFSTIMTANINSSMLLLQLAEICGNDKMQIERMTDWTFLSEVQNKENDKIEAAFEAIEELISKKDE